MGTPEHSQAPKQHKALTLTQLAGYDDLITDVLVDRAFYWTKIRKNRARYSSCRGVTEEQVTSILRQHAVVEQDPRTAFEKLIALPGLKKYANRLATDTERNHFQNHLRRYINMYLPDAPFEIATTNRYVIDQEEAAVYSRRDIRKGEPIRHLTGIQVPITPEEEESLDLMRRDFSIVVSSRKRMSSLFLGPARFANHDCDANCKLQTKGPSGMTVHAVKHIKLGDEITVSYGENYFGVDNCECLCATCEAKGRNGWAIPEDEDENAEDASQAGSEPSSRSTRRRGDISPRGSKSRGRSDEPAQSSPDRQTPDPSSKGTLKRKLLEVEEFQRTGRSPKRPEVSRLQASTSGPGRARTASPASASLAEDRSSEQRVPRDTSGSSLSSNGGSYKLKSQEDSGYESIAGSVEGSDPSRLSQPFQPLYYQSSSKAEPPSRFSVVTRDGNLTSILAAASSPGQQRRERISINSLLNEHGQNQTSGADDPMDIDGSLDSVTPTQARLANGEVPSEPSATISSPNGSLALVTPAEASSNTSVRSESVMRQPPAVSQRKTAHRRPGDYTLTATLLSEPYSRWVECQVCDTDFVQKNAYQTRFSCPRCERHSMLYGYRWPKTMQESADDDEERVMDHREINRFVAPTEEKAISKGKNKALKRLLSEREKQDTRSESVPEPVERTKNGRTFRANLGQRKLDEPDYSEFDAMPKKKPKVTKPTEADAAPTPEQKMPKPLARKHKATNRTGNKRLKIIKPTQKQKLASYYRDPNRPKRKYHRTGLYSRDPTIREAAYRKLGAENATKSAAAKIREREQEKLKRQNERAEAARQPKKEKPKLPAGLKPSKWKGYILEAVPVSDSVENPRKLYTTDGKRWEPETDAEDAAKDAHTALSTPLSSRPKRTIKPTPKSEPHARKAWMRGRETPSDEDDEDEDSFAIKRPSRKRLFESIRKTLSEPKPKSKGTDKSSQARRERIAGSARKSRVVHDTESESNSRPNDEADWTSDEIRASDSDYEVSDSPDPRAPRRRLFNARAHASGRRNGGRRKFSSSSITSSSVGSEVRKSGRRRSSTAISRGDSRTNASSRTQTQSAATKPAARTSGLPKGWAWPDETDIERLQRLEAEKEAREQAVRQKGRARKTM